MKYNNRLKIQFNFNPVFQGIYNFFGWQLVLDSYFESTDIKLYDGKYFVYTGNNWKQLIKYIKEA